MANTWSKLVLGAVMAGFLSSNVVLANEGAAPAEGEKKAQKGNKGKKAASTKENKEKHRCNADAEGKNGCKGKDGCNGENKE